MKAIIKVCVLRPIFVFCCAFFIFQLPANAQSVLEKEVSFNLDHIPLKKALETLETATKVKFVYSVNQIDVTTLVSIDTDGKTLAAILDQLLQPLDIEYKIQDNNEYIVLSRATHYIAKNNQAENGSISLVPISGKVIDIEGSALAGVNVMVKGTRAGTATDVHGRFSLQNTPPHAVIVFSFIGFSSSEVELEGQTSLTIVLEEEVAPLQEIVVTAMGIHRAEKSLSHGTQRLDALDLTRAKTDNMINALNGRVLGLTLFPSASGLGGSAKVVLRGNRSFSQSNQPLYILDGLPMLNSSNSNGQPNTPFGGQMDGGDGISNLNPDDLESVTILKGASASALYGSQAANGAILITTKRAQEGKTELNYNANVSVSDICYEPAFQNHYGRTGNNTRDSWGERIISSTEDKLKSFFQQGMSVINSLNLSVGSEKSKTYCSFANMQGEGVIPRNALKRNNFSLQQTQALLHQKLIVDVGLQYINQKIDNTPSMGLYFNPLTGLYLFPTGMSITPFKQYEFSENVGYARQHWFTSEDIQQNPWWIVNRNPNHSTRRRLLLSSNISYDVNRWLTVKVRGSMDRIEDQYKQNVYSGTQATLTGPNGQFINNSQIQEQKYADALLQIRIPIQKLFQINGVLGASITDAALDGTAIGPGLGLIMPDIFIAQNIMGSSSVNPVYTYPENHTQLQSVFGSFDASFSDCLHVNLTGRNDWSSNLSFTPNMSYFYPSAGVSVCLSDVVELPSKITYLKLRANYAEVGNTVPQYVTNPVNYFDNTGSVVLSTVAPFETLKPERTKTYEIGTDLRLLPNQLSIALNYYRSNTYNQFIKVSPSVATGYSVGYVNAGNVQNEGIEFSIGLTPLDRSGIRWTTLLNVANNINRIIDVDSKNGINKYLLTSNDNTSYQSVLAKGGSYGDIYGITLMRDEANRIVLNEDGTPRINESFSYLGNPNPKWIIGWNNTITYENFTFNFLIDTKIGGQVFSMTQAIMDQYGVSKESGEARDRGFVSVDGVNEKGEAISKVDPQRWYTSIGGRQGVSELYIYSATVARLREMSLSYSVPFESSFIRSLRVSFTGRNLFFLYRKAPYDPELVMSTGNGLSGIDIFSQPAVRSLGFALNLTI